MVKRKNNMQEMKRLIILEGLDRCGKSTQLEKLKNHFLNQNYKVNTYHAGRPKHPAKDYSVSYYIQQMYKIYDELIKDPNLIIILDRSFIGEIVWGDYRGYSGAESFIEIINCSVAEKLLNMAHIFIFKDELERLREREDGESMFSDSQVVDIIRKFEFACRLLKVKANFDSENVSYINLSEVGDETETFNYIIQQL